MNLKCIELIQLYIFQVNETELTELTRNISNCRIAGSTLETIFWHEVVAAADGAVDSGDRCTWPFVMLVTFSMGSIH